MKYVWSYGGGFIIIAAVLWGLDGILRRSLFSLPPITIVFYEHLIGAIILLPFFIYTWKKGEKLTKKEWSAISLVALLSGVLGTLWFTTALAKVNFISFSVVFLLQKLQPIFAILAGVMLLKEKVDRRYFGWAFLALAAAYFVTFKGGIVNFGDGSGTVIAALFAFGAAFAWGTSTAFSRFSLLRHSHTFITGLRFFLTVPIALLFVFFLDQIPSLGAPSGGQYVRLGIIALSTGMVALWLYYRGLKHTEAKISTILELVFPLTAVCIDIFLYHTTLAASQYVAAAVLLFAVYRVAKLHTPASQ
ncbi:MAG: DMT family transporter [Patescibacteria group bacterium]